MDRFHPQIEEYIRSHRTEMLELLEKLVRTESPSPAFTAQENILRILGNNLQEAGCRVDYIPGRGRSGGHLYARPREKNGGRSQLIAGHCDTVWPLGTLANMRFDVKGNTVHGPGVYDMKGGLVQGIFALKALHELGFQTALTPVFFINSDEEVGSPESTRYLKLLGRRVCRAFILEPALGLSGKLKTARKGGGRFVIHVEGRSAHAGLAPDEGASAILELSHVIQVAHGLNDPDRGITVNVGQIEGGVEANVVAPSSKAILDVRVLTHEDGRYIEEAIRGMRATTPGTTLRIEGRISRPPMEPTTQNRTLWDAAYDLGQSLDLFLEEGLAGGASDGNTVSQFAATLDGLGAVGDGAHAAHEFLYIDKMIERTAFLASLLLLPAELKVEPTLFSNETADSTGSGP